MIIELTRGQFAVIDDEDWPTVQGYKWTANGSHGSFYAMARFKVDVLMHRLLLGEDNPKILVDHADNDSLNNRRDNLRRCTHAENMRNSKVRSHSKSGVKNVSFTKVNGSMQWVATVRLDGKRHRRAFKTIEEAEAHAIALRATLHGAFAAPLRITPSERKA